MSGLRGVAGFLECWTGLEELGADFLHDDDRNYGSLWLLEPVDRPGVRPGPRCGHSLQDLVGDLLKSSVPPTCSMIQDRCHQVLEYVISALFHRFRGLVTSSFIGATRS